MMVDSPEENSNRALLFTQMSVRIESNKSDRFGGAFVVVPPTDGGEPLDTLILDNRQDAAQFWMLLKTKCDIELGLLDQKQRTGQAFGRR